MSGKSGYCLMAPRGALIVETFDVDRDECWSKSFGYLYRRKRWMTTFYKKWDESIAEAHKRGWRVIGAIVVADKKSL